MTNFLDLTPSQIEDMAYHLFENAESLGEPRFSNGAIVLPVYFDGGQVTLFIHEHEIVSRDRFNQQRFHTIKAQEFLKQNV
jgi:hypothetical protein